jgi:hypothetical protein
VLLHDKNFDKLGIEETYLSMIKAIYGNHRTNIIFISPYSMVETESFLFKVWKKARISLLPFLINIILDILARTIR